MVGVLSGEIKTTLVTSHTSQFKSKLFSYSFSSFCLEVTFWFLSLSLHSICDFFTTLAGAECDAEPPLFPPRALGGHSVRVQPDHSGPGGGSACGSAQRHRVPAAVHHEDLPRPPAGQPASLITRQPATQRMRIRTLSSPPLPSLHMHVFALFLLLFPPQCVLVRLTHRPVRLCRCRRTACWLSAASSSFKTSPSTS